MEKTGTGKGQIYQLKVTLKGIRPPIWRRVQVPAGISLAKLHDVLQVVMGWTNSHLHQFEVGRQRFGEPDPTGWSEVSDERRTRLNEVVRQAPAKFIYEYDMGDSWRHELVLEQVRPAEPGVRYPVCLTGRRAAPPEDCGGVWGYLDLLEALANPQAEGAEERLSWLGDAYDPEAFNSAAVNDALQRRR